ncbi:MAG: hypothetical protein RL758_276 [Pseudomonadota bacterium]|jgi:hypothetical protein
MGLLDSFGDGFEDPKSQAIMALAGGLLSARGPRGLSAGLLGANHAFNQGKKLELEGALQKAHADAYSADAADKQRKLQIEALKQKMLPAIMAAGGSIDVQSALAAGFSPEEIAKLASLRNVNLEKVARTVDSTDANGRPVTQQMDDYGRPVGQGLNQWKAPSVQDMGGSLSSFDPVSKQLSPLAAKTRSPDAMAANLVAMRGQDMTDARAGETHRAAQDQKQLEQQQKQDGAVASIDTAISTLGRLIQHPGLPMATGLYSIVPAIPGSNSANFEAELEALKAQTFLPMVEKMRGTGALSDAEGKKLAAAVGALDPKMSTKEFRESMGRVMSDLEASRARAARSPDSPQGGASGGWGNTKSGESVRVSSVSEAMALPKGTVFQTPDGRWKVR